MPKKLEYSYVKRSIEQESYKLISKVYINATVKLEIECPNNHKYFVKFHDFLRGRRCPICWNLSGRNRRHSYKYIKTQIEKEKYKLLSKEYKNDITHIKLECPNGHKYKAIYSNFRNGKRCPICYYITKFGEGNPSWKGGIQNNPYCEMWKDKEYKKNILERDNNICLNPDCWKTSNRMVIHHINYDKKECHPKNLISVCQSCNSRANTDRDWWQAWYSLIIQKRYNYAVQTT